MTIYIKKYSTINSVEAITCFTSTRSELINLREGCFSYNNKIVDLWNLCLNFREQVTIRAAVNAELMEGHVIPTARIATNYLQLVLCTLFRCLIVQSKAI